MLHSELPSTYDPLNDQVYMSAQMVSYFKTQLTQMLAEILEKEAQISLSLMHNNQREPDPVDQGINEELHYQDFGFQVYEDRVRQEVESALHRIKHGTYGYCEETDEPIGVQRLLATPYAKYCVDVQAHKERERKRTA